MEYEPIKALAHLRLGDEYGCGSPKGERHHHDEDGVVRPKQSPRH